MYFEISNVKCRVTVFFITTPWMIVNISLMEFALPTQLGPLLTSTAFAFLISNANFMCDFNGRKGLKKELKVCELENQVPICFIFVI